MPYVLERHRDNLKFAGPLCNEPIVGEVVKHYSSFWGPTWTTTPVTKIVSLDTDADENRTWVFETENSTYTLREI